MSLNIILIILCVLSMSLSVFLGWKLYQFALLIIDIEDAIEESLDVLDSKYSSMNEIVQRPIFFDSVEIRQVINDIKDCHRSILVIANKITKNMGSENSGEIKKEDS